MKKKVYIYKTPILPLSFATCAISLVPGTWDIPRFKTVSGLLDHPVISKDTSVKEKKIPEFTKFESKQGRERLTMFIKT
jgi:hypothetical protein